MKKMFLKFLLLPISILLVVSFASGVGMYKMGNAYSKGFGGMLVGALHNFGISDVNRSLESYGFPGLGDVFLSLGGMGFSVFNNGVIVGGTGIFNTSSTTESRINGTNVIAIMSGGYGFFEIGYNFMNDSSFVLAPIFGVGGGGTSLKFSVREERSYDFDEVVKNPTTRKFSVDYSGFGVEVGVLALFGVKIYEREKSCNGFEIKNEGLLNVGLRVSYFYVFNNGDSSIRGEPNYSGHNILASLFIGWGSSHKSMKQ